MSDLAEILEGAQPRMERIKMACPCGATMETESNYSSTVDYRQKWFQEAHSTHLGAQQETPASAHLSQGPSAHNSLRHIHQLLKAALAREAKA